MLDARFYEKLKQFRLHMKYRSEHHSEGGRTVRKKGKSMDFSGFREYVPGDDLRFLDWNGYARSGKLNIKEFLEERESRVTIVLDQSLSMQEAEKKERSMELAFALAVMAVMGGDRVRMISLSDGVHERSIMGQRSELTKLKQFLEKSEYVGSANLMKELKKLPVNGPGLMIVISDFLEEDVEERIPELLKYLAFRKQEVKLIQMLSKEEMEPTELGTFRLIDSEDEKKNLRVILDRRTLEQYKEEVDRYTGMLSKNAKKESAGYFLCCAEKKFDRLLLEDLRALYD